MKFSLFFEAISQICVFNTTKAYVLFADIICRNKMVSTEDRCLIKKILRTKKDTVLKINV